MEHWEQTGHPVVCKLGTITAEGTASIHCYKCDDEVLDEKLGEHLSKLGIDILSQVKTEKTMIELNLEANMNLTLSKAVEEGRVLVPKFGPGFTGLINLGNTCYMASIVQVLFSLEAYQNKYFSDAAEKLSSCSKFTPDCFCC